MSNYTEHLLLSHNKHLQSGVRGIGGNSTLVVLVPGHQNIATDSPVLAPAAREFIQQSGTEQSLDYHSSADYLFFTR